jgi:phosphatidylserine/phosphatidylglycerophosphate/cardiolipin synthase-like enzyme
VALLILAARHGLTGSDLPDLVTLTDLYPPDVDWWQVHFTDPRDVNDSDDTDGSIPEKLIDDINNAERSIHIAAAEFNLTSVAEALIAARSRGVEVKWITDDKDGVEADERQGYRLLVQLRRAGIIVNDDARSGTMHNNFWVFDARRVWTGSAQATLSSTFRDINHALMIDSPELAAIYERKFAEMWAGQSGPDSPSTSDNQALVVDRTRIQVLFAPEDANPRQLIELIGNATRSLRFMAISLDHPGWAAAVQARATAGMDVKGIVETLGVGSETSVWSELACAGVPVRQDGNRGILHHQVVVIDNKTVITGSFDFTANTDRSNAGNVIVLTNRAIASSYLQEFERRWAEAGELAAENTSCN